MLSLSIRLLLQYTLLSTGNPDRCSYWQHIRQYLSLDSLGLNWLQLRCLFRLSRSDSPLTSLLLLRSTTKFFVKVSLLRTFLQFSIMPRRLGSCVKSALYLQQPLPTLVLNAANFYLNRPLYHQWRFLVSGKSDSCLIKCVHIAIDLYRLCCTTF